MAFTILVPLDASRYAVSAKRVALQLAAAAPVGRIVALHVCKVRPPDGNVLEDLTGRLGFEPAVVPEAQAELARRAGQELLDALVADGRAVGVDVEPRFEIGHVAKTILKHSEDADLVVMGIRGETEERFPGQGGEMIAWLPQRLHTPMLMVPRGVDRITRIGVGFDGSVSAHHAVRAVRMLTERVKVPVDAIFVSSDGTGAEILADVDAQLPGIEVVHHVEVRGDDVHDVLRETAQRLGDSVLALGFHGRNRLHDFLFGTTSERIAIDGTLGLVVAH